MPKISYTRRAEKDLARIDRVDRQRIKESIEGLGSGRSVALPLSGEWKGFFKLRVGDYRTIFQKLSPSGFLVRFIRHRRDAYRY